MIDLREDRLGAAQIPERPERVVTAEVHERAGAVLFWVSEPIEEIPAYAAGAGAAVPDDAVQAPDLAQRAGIGLRFGRVIGRPPGHLVVHQDFDVVLAGQ